jgi:stage II sporulation protein D
VKKVQTGFVFKGKGSGHGVGLSQWGAKGMAEKGFIYRDILKHFYPGTRLVKIN